MGKKKCKKCGLEKQLDAFRNNPNTKDLKDNTCKVCRAEDEKSLSLNYKTNRTTLLVPDFKFCSSCKKTLPKNSFWKNSSKKSGLNTYCKLCSSFMKKVNVQKLSYQENLLMAIDMANGTMISKEKYTAIFNGLSSVGKKIYQCVPLKQPWDSGAIYAELRRTGVNQDIENVRGILSMLVKNGLIIELEKGVFIRTEIKQKQANTHKPENEESIKNDEPILDDSSPLVILANLANMAAELKEKIGQFESMIETAAIKIDDKFKDSQEKARKLTQLQQLLKGLSD